MMKFKFFLYNLENDECYAIVQGPNAHDCNTRACVLKDQLQTRHGQSFATATILPQWVSFSVDRYLIVIDTTKKEDE